MPIVFGCSNGNYQVFKDALTPTGRTLAKRTFEQTDAPSIWEVRSSPELTVIDTTLSPTTTNLNNMIAQLQTYPVRPYISYYHEPEDNLTASQFVTNFRTFSDAVRPYAQVVHCMMAYSYRAPGIAQYGDPSLWYPGDAYVDIIAPDGYANQTDPNNYWTPTEIFGAALTFCRAHDKPWGLSELGAKTDTTPATSDAFLVPWMESIHEWLADIPETEYVMYFNQTGPQGDHRIDSYPGTMLAYSQMMDELGPRTSASYISME